MMSLPLQTHPGSPYPFPHPGGSAAARGQPVQTAEEPAVAGPAESAAALAALAAALVVAPVPAAPSEPAARGTFVVGREEGWAGAAGGGSTVETASGCRSVVERAGSTALVGSTSAGTWIAGSEAV